MNPDDNFQKNLSNLKTSVKGIVTLDCTTENLVNNFNSNDGKVLDNCKTTVTENWEMFDLNVKEAHKRGLKVAGVDKDVS